MINKTEVFVLLILFAGAFILLFNPSLTGNVTLIDTNSGMQLCEMATGSDHCFIGETRGPSVGIQTQQLSDVEWAAKLSKFGVDCNFIQQGKVTLDSNGDIIEVKAIIGKDGYCYFNGQRKFVTAGSRIGYTKQGAAKIPNLVSYSVFPSESQTSTRNVVRACFKDTNKYSLVNANLKNINDGKITVVALYDDGNHFDGEAGDGCYGKVLDGLLAQGQYSIGYTISAA